MRKAKRNTRDRDEVAKSRDHPGGPEGLAIEALVRQYRRTGDLVLRDQIVSQHLYLVQTVARKFAGLGESHEDLLQEGAMGLLRAAELYDPDRNVQFSTYATHLVEGQIRHYLRDRGKLIKQPAWVQELTAKITKASEALSQELGRPPAPEEIAARISSSAQMVCRILEARERSKVASLDAAQGDDGDSPALDPEKLVRDDPDQVHLPIEDRIFLRQAMARLKALERKVVHHFYYLDLNQTEIARKLGISVNYASYLLRGAIAKLKQAFESQKLDRLGDRALSAAELAGGEQARQVAGIPARPPGRALAGQAYSLSLRPAPTDPITGLPTEGCFLERLHQEVARASRYPQQFSVLMVEVVGPAAEGEERESLLSEIARLIRANVRSIDLLARLRPPSPAFGLLLPHTGRQAGVLGERIVHMAPTRLGRTPADITVVIGFAVFPTDGLSAEDLLSAAEAALALARSQGGNRCLRASPA